MCLEHPLQNVGDEIYHFLHTPKLGDPSPIPTANKTRKGVPEAPSRYRSLLMESDPKG